jgi:hypothetical protein
LNELADGFAWRHKLDMLVEAFGASNIMNASGNMRSKVTPEKLLGHGFLQEMLVDAGVQEAAPPEAGRLTVGQMVKEFAGFRREFEEAWALAVRP